MEPSLKSAPMMVAREGKRAKEVSLRLCFQRITSTQFQGLQKKGTLFCITFQDLLKSKTFFFDCFAYFCIFVQQQSETFLYKDTKTFLLPPEHLVIGRT